MRGPAALDPGSSTRAPDAAESAARPLYFPEFEGLRAIAALLVVVVHTGFTSGFTTHPGPWGRYTSRGEIGVSVFFLISGFLLYRPFVGAHLNNAASPRTGPYLLRRAARILPLYWLVLTIAIALHGTKPVVGASGWFSFYTLTQVYTPSHDAGGLTQAWSLDIEVTFYLMLPVYALLIRRLTAGRDRRHQLRIEACGLIAMFVVSEAFKVWAQLAKPPYHGVMGNWLPSYLDLFAVGMALALLSTATATTADGSRLPDWVRAPWIASASWLLAVASLLGASWLADLPRIPVFSASLHQVVLQRLFYGLFGFFLLLPAALSPNGRGLVRRFLRCRPMAYLGLISYGVYLWHQLVIGKLLDWTGWNLFTAPWGELLLATSAATLVLASVSYVLVERPGMSLGRRAVKLRQVRETEAIGHR